MALKLFGGKKKLGLALGGGAARGLAHIGVLEVLEREGIHVNLVAGTSIGAIVGSLYAREPDAFSIKQKALSLDWIKFTSLFDVALPTSGFFTGRKVVHLLRSFLGGDISFDELKIPFACVAADVMTGEEIVFKEGKVLEAVRASISIPVIMKAVRWQDRFLVDGEMVNPVPVDVVKKMGADFVIAVKVTPEMKELPIAKKTQKTHKEPSIFTIMLHTLYMHSNVMTEKCPLDADVVIRPRVAHIGPAEFLRAKELIQLGELAALEQIDEIKKKLR